MEAPNYYACICPLGLERVWGRWCQTTGQSPMPGEGYCLILRISAPTLQVPNGAVEPTGRAAARLEGAAGKLSWKLPNTPGGKA